MYMADVGQDSLLSDRIYTDESRPGSEAATRLLLTNCCRVVLPRLHDEVALLAV